MHAVVRIAIIKPIEWLYLNAPELGGFGGHEGLPKDEVCARITGVAPHHWQAAGGPACDLLIDRKVRALATTLFVFLYIYLIVTLYTCLLQAAQAVVHQNISSFFKCSGSPHRRPLCPPGMVEARSEPTPSRTGRWRPSS